MAAYLALLIGCCVGLGGSALFSVLAMVRAPLRWWHELAASVLLKQFHGSAVAIDPHPAQAFSLCFFGAAANDGHRGLHRCRTVVDRFHLCVQALISNLRLAPPAREHRLSTCVNLHVVEPGESFSNLMRKGGAAAVSEATRFFMKDDRVHQALFAITARLRESGIAYAVAGGMALVAHGYDRTTEDVDILVDLQGLKQIHQELDGLGYVTPFPGSKNLRHAATGVRIEFLITGAFPGDGKPKTVAFPDPKDAGIEMDGIRYLSLPSLLELKLASGMTAPHRLKDLADAQELIRLLKLPRQMSERLNPYVREKYDELWVAIQQSPKEE